MATTRRPRSATTSRGRDPSLALGGLRLAALGDSPPPASRRGTASPGVRAPTAPSDAIVRLRVPGETLLRRTDPASLPEIPAASTLLDLAPPVLARTLTAWLQAPPPADHLLLVVPDDLSIADALVPTLTAAVSRRGARYDVVYACPPGTRSPVPLTLPPGSGPALTAAVDTLLGRLGDSVVNVLASARANRTLNQLSEDEAEGQRAALATLERTARRAGYEIRSTPEGLQTVPILHGKPLSVEQMGALDLATRKVLEEAEQRLNAALSRTTDRVRSLSAATEAARGSALDGLAAEQVNAEINSLLLPLVADAPAAAAWVELLRDLLHQRWTELASASAADIDPASVDVLKRDLRPTLFVSRADGPPPVVVVHDVSDSELFGGVEQTPPEGPPRPWAGLVHEAAGGFLVIELATALESPERWRRLRAMLRSGRSAPLGDGRPLQPAPANARVVLVARGDTAEAIDNDLDLSLLFRVRLDLESCVPRVPSATLALDGLIHTLATQRGWGRLDREARALVVDLGARIAERFDQLPLAIGPLEEVLAFAAGAAVAEGQGVITASHVRRAWSDRLDRLGAVERRVRVLTGAGEVRVETTGTRVGVINGLAVLGNGGVSFGHPVRITAVVSPGREGIVDVERESDLGGAVHTKGVAILRGYLARVFGQQRPLSLRAQLVVEQSYGGIEGDSAAAAELFALLSEVAAVPLAQHIAVTGSVNQLGEIQAIGGVIAKIEGFYDVCAERGLTGQQGVLLPRVNLPHVVLREDVAAAIAAGRFHLWLMDQVEDGIAVLTGLEAGRRDADGYFPAASVFGRVERRLIELAERLRASEMIPVEPPSEG